MNAVRGVLVCCSKFAVLQCLKLFFLYAIKTLITVILLCWILTSFRILFCNINSVGIGPYVFSLSLLRQCPHTAFRSVTVGPSSLFFPFGYEHCLIRDGTAPETCALRLHQSSSVLFQRKFASWIMLVL